MVWRMQGILIKRVILIMDTVLAQVLLTVSTRYFSTSMLCCTIACRCLLMHILLMPLLTPNCFFYVKQQILICAWKILLKFFAYIKGTLFGCNSAFLITLLYLSLCFMVSEDSHSMFYSRWKAPLDYGFIYAWVAKGWLIYFPVCIAILLVIPECLYKWSYYSWAQF